MLDRLPDELLAAFFSTFGSDQRSLVHIDARIGTGRIAAKDAATERGRQVAVHAVMLVDRRCCAIGRPHLYRRIYVSSWDALLSLVTTMAGADPAIWYDVHTLLIDIGAASVGPHGATEAADGLGRSREEVLGYLISNCPGLRTLAVAARPSERMWPASVTSMLTRLSVETLSSCDVARLLGAVSELRVFVTEGISSAIGSSQPFDSLTKLDIVSGPGSYEPFVARFVRQCPRLRQIRIGRATFGEVGMMFARWTDDRLVHVVLRYCRPALSGDNNLILPASVQRLTIEPWDAWDANDASSPVPSIWLRNLVASLVAGKLAALRYLRIRIGGAQVVRPDDVDALRVLAESQGIELDLHIAVRRQRSIGWTDSRSAAISSSGPSR